MLERFCVFADLGVFARKQHRTVVKSDSRKTLRSAKSLSFKVKTL